MRGTGLAYRRRELPCWRQICRADSCSAVRVITRSHAAPRTVMYSSALGGAQFRDSKGVHVFREHLRERYPSRLLLPPPSRQLAITNSGVSADTRGHGAFAR
jgi:hypothetical protein